MRSADSTQTKSNVSLRNEVNGELIRRINGIINSKRHRFRVLGRLFARFGLKNVPVRDEVKLYELSSSHFSELLQLVSIPPQLEQTTPQRQGQRKCARSARSSSQLKMYDSLRFFFGSSSPICSKSTANVAASFQFPPFSLQSIRTHGRDSTRNGSKEASANRKKVYLHRPFSPLLSVSSSFERKFHSLST